VLEQFDKTEFRNINSYGITTLTLDTNFLTCYKFIEVNHYKSRVLKDLDTNCLRRSEISIVIMQRINQNEN
jgi:hypothetical protein